MGGCSPEEKVMKKKIVLFFRTINSIDTKCDETMFKMRERFKFCVNRKN